MDYDIKKGWYKNIEGDALKDLMQEVFGNVKQDGDVLVSSYGVMSRIEVKVLAKDKMIITTENSKTADMTDESILDSKRKLNLFAEKATGFNAKARMKRAQQKAKKGE
ncbi:MAG: DUF5611 family protein [Candidatus Methanomethylophilaceae archaeon]|jgi:hypothetical protein